jgi:gamma-glutamyltranspeptidase/glutathione hydrolase
VWEIPPNGQGIAALEALSILEGFDMASKPRDSVESWHLQIESMKLAFADAHRYVAAPDPAAVPVEGLLDPAYVAQRRALISDRARDPEPGEPPRGGTVYLCAADADGMMVSYIQSNYQGFGSGVVVPGTGISLQNRGHGFSLRPGHPNLVAPGKRPYHTIIPGFLTREGEAVGPFGVMGAEMQPQGHLQMIVNQVDHGMNPQTSLDAPRWRWLRGLEVMVEPEAGREVIAGLEARGHTIVPADTASQFNATGGRGQIIRRLPQGGYVAGSEPRSDGAAVGY